MGIFFWMPKILPFRRQKPGALSISDQLDGKDLSLNLEADKNLGTPGRTWEVSACQRMMNILHEDIEIWQASVFLGYMNRLPVSY